MSRSAHRFELALAVAAGSAMGASLRLAVSMLTPAAWLGTLLVNVAGASLMGYGARCLLASPRPRLQAFWLPGFCGGFTSLSSFSWEWLQLADRLEVATPSGAFLLLGALAGASAAWIVGAAMGWRLAGGRAEFAREHR